MNESSSIQKKLLFTDVRHIRCGDLEWLSPEGTRLPVAGPPEPQAEARATTGMVPYCIRLVAQKAKADLVPQGLQFSRIMFENGLYRSWRLTTEHRPGENLGSYSVTAPTSVAILYADSKDGFKWVERHRCPFQAIGQIGFDGFTFFMDPKAEPNERYKAVYTAHPPKEQFPALWEGYQKVHPRYRDVRMRSDRLYCMYGLVSPDGLDWRPLSEPLMVHMSDTDTTVYYDSWLERYVMYTRLYWQERRWIGRAEAEDFRRWGPVQPLIWPGLDGSLSTDVYLNGRTTYPGEPSYHFLFPMFYHRFTQRSDVQMFSSADGICWNLVPGGPVVTPDLLGEDCEYMYATKDLVPLSGGRVGIPCGGTRFPHKYPRWKPVLESHKSAWAWWPEGRLCAVTVDEKGEFWTFPVTPAGRELRLNVRTKRSGEVRVGVHGVNGRSAADCDPICGDHQAFTVRWKGQSDIGTKEGEKVTLHFQLRAAEIFGLQWS